MRVWILSFSLFAAVTVSSFGQSAASSCRLYLTLSDLNQKYDVMQEILSFDDQTLESFMADSLDELVTGALSHYRSDPAAYDTWEKLTLSIIRELGDLEGHSAAATVWDVARTVDSSLLKADSYIALGNMGATEYASGIALVLRNLNFNTRSDAVGAEAEAYAAVYALGKMKEAVGIEPLVYASFGWYRDKVKSLARASVLSFSDGLEEQMSRIISDATDSSDKRRILALMMDTEASAESKGSVAVTALSEGLAYAESDKSLNRELANLRQDAIRDLIALKVSAPNSPGLLDKAIDRGDQDEKLIAIQALGADGGDAAAGVLVRRLNEINARQDAGVAVDQDELAVLYALIDALGASGNKMGLEPLNNMMYYGYTNAVIRHSRRAMAQIQGQ